MHLITENKLSDINIPDFVRVSHYAKKEIRCFKRERNQRVYIYNYNTGVFGLFQLKKLKNL